MGESQSQDFLRCVKFRYSQIKTTMRKIPYVKDRYSVNLKDVLRPISFYAFLPTISW